MAQRQRSRKTPVRRLVGQAFELVSNGLSRRGSPNAPLRIKGFGAEMNHFRLTTQGELNLQIMVRTSLAKLACPPGNPGFPSAARGYV